MASQSDTQHAEGSTADKGPNLTNRLHQSKSPYVRGHMNNPVAWQLWDSEAIDLAKKFNRLIFVSIGYSACHWCHVMEKESFTSPEVASTLNESFIPIKLDREERPDIDDVYMNYVQATTGSGGWPLNVFLTPDLEPVFGGTYWPGPNSSSLPRLGAEGPVGFVDILEKLRDVWNTQQLRCRQSAKDITRQLREFAEEGTHSHHDEKGEEKEDLEVELLEEAFRHFSKRFDSVNGGFSHAPKFPTPANLSFLLRLGKYPASVLDVIGHDECSHATTMAVQTLVKMARGGIRDHIGYGFCRYSVTADWSLPHFEKMLYDQAQLLDVYVDGFTASQEPELLGAIYDIATYLTTGPMLSPLGGLCSSEDADSIPNPNDNEKREGAFYVWTLKELKQILGQRDAGVCARHWGVLADGNVARQNDPHDEFMNQNVLSIQCTPSKLAKDFGLSEDEVVKIIKTSRQKLREYREEKRVRPDLDDKIIVGWNGLAVGALAKCSTALESIDSAKAAECLATAKNIVKFVKENLFDSATGQLWRIYRGDSKGDTPGFADDYAYFIYGLINMYEGTFDDSYLQFADELQKYLNGNFLAPGSDPETSTGYFMTSSAPTPGAPGPLLRLKPGTDSATPSANGVIAQNLLRLSALFEDSNYQDLAEQTCNAFSVEILQHPFLFVGLLDAIVGLEIGVKSVVGVLSSQGPIPQPSPTSGEEIKPENEVNQSADVTIEKKMRAEAGPATSTSTAVLSRINFLSSENERKTEWLRQRNETLKDLGKEKNFLLVCEEKVCRTIDL